MEDTKVIPFLNKKVGEQEFWNIYLRLLNVYNNKNGLTDKEINVTSFILSQDLKVDYFSVQHQRLITEKLDKTGTAELHRIKNKLIELGVLIMKDDNKDARKRIHQFNNNILTLKELVNKHITNYTFTLKLKINE